MFLGLKLKTVSGLIKRKLQRVNVTASQLLEPEGNPLKVSSQNNLNTATRDGASSECKSVTTLLPWRHNETYIHIEALPPPQQQQLHVKPCLFSHAYTQVLPRQTCGLYTHTIKLGKYPGGPDALHGLINGGSLFESVLFNKVSSVVVLVVSGQWWFIRFTLDDTDHYLARLSVCLFVSGILSEVTLSRTLRLKC